MSLYEICQCDCDCSKVDESCQGGQCNDCDNGIHWDSLKNQYVNYESDGN